MNPGNQGDGSPADGLPGAARRDEAFAHLFYAVVHLFESMRPTGRDEQIQDCLVSAWEAHEKAEPQATPPERSGGVHICPACSCSNLEIQALGWLGNPQEDPSEARCHTCNWKGTLGQAIPPVGGAQP